MSQQIQGDEMHSFAKFALPLLGLAIMAPETSLAQERDRSKIADQYKWNLADLYPSDAAWKEAKQRLTETNPAAERSVSIPALKKYKGTLSTSAQQLLECLDLVTELNKEFSRLYAYANMSFDQDTKVQSYLGMQQEMSQLGASFGADGDRSRSADTTQARD
jgi:oligoendopeptidase F